jgi:hypothetical protein
MYKLLLWLHIIFGSISLISGTLNICMKKGGKTHRLVGKLFIWSMIVSGILAIIMTLLHPNLFLFFIAVFSLYLSSVGYLYIRQPFLSKTLKAISVTMLIAGIAFVIYGLLALSKSSFGIVPVVFGTIGIILSIQDIKAHQLDYKGRLVMHLQRVTAAYISTTTAFLVVNLKLPESIPNFIPWLLPTIIITPFIVRWSRQYSKKNKASVK